MTDLERDVLAHLHANGAQSPETLAATMAADAGDVRAAIDALLAAGHLVREGARLVPDTASRTTPGLFVATERADAAPVEADLSDDER